MIFHARPRFTKDIDIFVKADPANERQPGEKRMHRRELIRRMVLNAICDDFENVDQIILPVIARDCGKLGLVVERPEVLAKDI